MLNDLHFYWVVHIISWFIRKNLAFKFYFSFIFHTSKMSLCKKTFCLLDIFSYIFFSFHLFSNSTPTCRPNSTAVGWRRSWSCFLKEGRIRRYDPICLSFYDCLTDYLLRVPANKFEEWVVNFWMGKWIDNCWKDSEI